MDNSKIAMMLLIEASEEFGPLCIGSEMRVVGPAHILDELESRGIVKFDSGKLILEYNENIDGIRLRCCGLETRVMKVRLDQQQAA